MAGVWDFTGKVGNSQVDEKEQTCGKYILAGNNGAQRKSEGKSVAWIPLSSAALNLSVLGWMCSGPSPESGFSSICVPLGREERKSEVRSESFVP